MTTKPAAAQDLEPNALPHEVYCACCPRKVSLLTRTYSLSRSHHSDPDLREYIEYIEPVRPRPFSPPGDYGVFIRGLFLTVGERRGHAHLTQYDLPAETTPHGRKAYLLPSFALELGKVVWVCPTCEEIFKGHAFNVEQYLAERDWIMNNLGGVRFKLANSF